MTHEERRNSHVIIHVAALAAAGVGAGLAPLPGSDRLALTPIQLGMIAGLALVFGVTLERGTAKATLATARATLIGRGISQVALRWLPVIGNVVNAVTAAGVTETIGWTVAHDFALRKK